MLFFSDNNISQGSVETRLRCGGTFYYDSTRNLRLSTSLVEFKNRSVFGKVRGTNIVAPFFGHGIHADSMLRLTLVKSGQFQDVTAGNSVL